MPAATGAGGTPSLPRAARVAAPAGAMTTPGAGQANRPPGPGAYEPGRSLPLGCAGPRPAYAGAARGRSPSAWRRCQRAYSSRTACCSRAWASGVIGWATS